MKKYKSTIKLYEMAYLGNVGQLRIEVHTDHEPKHFHIIKKDNFDVRISIKNLKVISYKWQKNNKEINSSEIIKIKEWMKNLSQKNKNITNYEAIKFAWNILN